MERLFTSIYILMVCILLDIMVSRCEMKHSTKLDYEEQFNKTFHGFQTSSAINNDIKIEPKASCELEVTNKSAKTFSRLVLKNKYNFVYFNITFKGVHVIENDQVIMYTRWIWTFKGENGAHEYLFLPNDFGYLSLGLLWTHTLVEPLPVEIRVKKNAQCSTLTGGADADQKIGEALGNMTKEIAALKDEYNSSYWCYSKRVLIDSDIIFAACENAVCTMQTFEYSCCKFKLDFLTKKRHVECQKEHYYFGAIWWLLPILIGETLFAFYPLLLTSFGCRLRSFSRQSSQLSVTLQDVNDIEESGPTQFVRVSKHRPPVTFLSTVCGPLTHCNTEGRVFSRVIRVTIIILPLSLTMIRILLDYKYAGELVKAAVAKGALVGFTTMIADFESGTYYFLRYMGGPFIALPLFLVFGCLLLVVPSNLEELLEGGLMEFSGKSSFLFTLSVENKARLAGVNIRHANGYKRIQKTLLSQVLMLLNSTFWKQTFKLFITRFTKIVYPTLKGVTNSSCLAVVFGIVPLLLYVVFCVMELIFAFIYFVFPVISCFFIFVKAYVKSTRAVLRVGTRCNQVIALIPTIVVVIIFTYTWYMYCLIFFDAFWFLTKIVSFTYTGVIAYPKISYGYLILSLMALYYIAESFNGFRQSYQDLLSISIKACQKVEEKLAREEEMTVFILCDDGIAADLWNLIVERHRPKRIQVTYTLFQLLAIISVLSISLELLFRFDKVHDLSLITHVFTALVICALPKIAKSICTNGQRYKQQKKLYLKIKQTVYDYLNNETETDTETDIYIFQRADQYEELTD